MTVKKLMEKLATLNPEAVVVCGDEEGDERHIDCVHNLQFIGSSRVVLVSGSLI